MKKLKFVLTMVVLCYTYVDALTQNCNLPSAAAFTQSNNISARILNGGDLFTNFNTGRGQFIPSPDPTNPSSVATIYSAGLWMGGIDLNGNLKLAAVDYRSSGKGDYSAGPLDQNGLTDASNCSNWDKVFRVAGTEISAFRAALPLTEDDAIAQFPSIMGWPGGGNPHFSLLNGFDISLNEPNLAPFVDTDGDGLYKPLNGDYPAVLLKGQSPFSPAEIIWCVFNDHKGGAPHSETAGKPFNAEIQLTVWTMTSQAYPVLNNTVFTSHKIINRGTEITDSTFIGLWADIDLGCYLDDYIGSNPELNAFFAYNQDMIDGNLGNTCQGTSTFPDIAPVQSVTMLGQSMDRFSYFNGESSVPGTTPPNGPLEYYRVLSGSWRDGSSITDGSNGYGGNTPVTHVFPDDPSDVSGWSMCTANLASADRQVLALHKIGTLYPGQIEELTAAWSVHYITESPCSLGNTFTEIQTITDIYENGFSNLSKVHELAQLNFTLLPNPGSDKIICKYGDLKVNEIRIYNAGGKLMESMRDLDSGQTMLDVSTFAKGIYIVQIIGAEGIGAQKISVVR